MNRIQYTIRSIPAKLDQVLRRESQATGKSLNEVVVSTLEKGAGVSPDTSFDDLNWFIGNKSLSSSFEDDIKWLNSAPKEI